MEFMLLFMQAKGALKGEPEGFAAMHELALELGDAGTLRRGAPLTDEVTHVRVHGGKAVVSDGPFAESKEIVGGFWIVEVANRDEALAIAARTPHAHGGVVEVHAVRWRRSGADPEKGKPFMMVFGIEPGLTDPDGSKLKEMLDYVEVLKRDGKFIETAPLASEPPAARVETRNGRTLVTDGPFAEAKETVGGYGLVRAAGREQAIELAKRYPHAKWGLVEVREIMFFDRTRD